jgi:hypothetical protein
MYAKEGITHKNYFNNKRTTILYKLNKIYNYSFRFILQYLIDLIPLDWFSNSIDDNIIKLMRIENGL